MSDKRVCTLAAGGSQKRLTVCQAEDLIEKLQAELAKAESLFDSLGRQRDVYEDALAALKARRCWTCRGHAYLSHGGNAYKSDRFLACPMFGKEFWSEGFCHRWNAREDAP